MAGKTIDAAAINSLAAQLTQSMFSTMRAVRDFNATMIAPNSQATFTSTYGYPSADTAILYNAWTDLNDMSLVWFGSPPAFGIPQAYSTPGTARNMQANAAKLILPGVY